MLLNIVSQIFIILLIIIAIVLLLLLISYFECNTFKLKKYDLYNNKNKDNLKIIFLTDFHNKNFHNKINALVNKILYEMPDIIILGGDFINFSKYMMKNNEVGMDNTIKFIDILCKKINYKYSDKIKIFFALGNHELRLKRCKKPKLENKYLEFIRFLLNNNIHILEDGTINISDSFTLSTLNLYDGYYNKVFNKDKNYKVIDAKIFEKYFNDLDNDCFNIAAFHKPDYAIDFINYGFDLVLSGHYHGGIVKLPFLGVLFSPDIMPFPKYGYGLYKILTKYIVVSSGLGEHFINIRINNYPEICLINIIGDGRDKV